MSNTVYHDGDEGVSLIVKGSKPKRGERGSHRPSSGGPVHVVYGGADRYSAQTPRKLGDLALASLERYGGNFLEFAHAVRLPGSQTLPSGSDDAMRLERMILRNRSKARIELYEAWFAHTVFSRITAKLRSEPVEDFRIDFEDGYGFRPDEEEDAEAERTAAELARANDGGAATRFKGVRIKSFQPETYERATRTLSIFLDTLHRTANRFPDQFVVTLPKITEPKQVKDLAARLRKFEKKTGLEPGTIGIEIMIETAEAIIGKKGRIMPALLADAGKGRVTSAHFGAYDHTASLGISANDQRIDHPACNFARQIMLASLAPLGIRLSDSVTTLLPVPVHSGRSLRNEQRAENVRAVHAGWAEHFRNVTAAMRDGFYQSWDLHPNQLPARYAAVFAFFLANFDGQAARLRSFVERATRATLSGNTFDDAASAQGIMNFFVRGIDCKALTEKEVAVATGLAARELRSSFNAIAETRR